jgi:chitodextrinase
MIRRLIIKRVTLIILITLLAVSLTACGGGGGGGGVGGGEGISISMTLTASAISPTEIDLSWSPAPTTPTDYRIYMNGTYYCTTYPSWGTQFTINRLNPDTTYCFEVYAFYFPFGAMHKTNAACATTLHDSPPSTPANLVANAVSPVQIDLSWDASTDDYGVIGYKIYRDGTYLRSVTGTSTSDTGLNPETNYCYRVSAYDGVGNESAQSGQACATTLPDSPPTTPTNLVANAVSPTQINLSWDASTDDYGVTGYNIYREGTYLKSVTGTSTSDTGLSPVTVYCYTVSAYDAGGNESAQSGQACATTPLDVTPPTSPTNLLAIRVSPTQINLSWDASTDDYGVTGYNIYREGTYLKSVTGTSTSDTGLDKSIRYCYTVSAYDAAGNESAPSDQACAITWTITTIDSQGEYYTSIAIDSADNVHISYWDAPNADLKYATNASGAWVTDTIDSQGIVGQYTSIAIDSADNVHISYGDSTNHALKYATNASGAWATDTIDGQGDVGQYTSIAIDSADNVHISYWDSTNDALTYVTNEPGAWDKYTISHAEEMTQLGYTSIASDSANMVHISYATSSSVKYATNR